LRKDSNTFGKHNSFNLTGLNKRQLYIPRGFAHGYSVLHDETIVFYKCDNIYNKKSEAGINPYDKNLNIHWYINENEAIMSSKDREWPDFWQCKKQ